MLRFLRLAGVAAALAGALGTASPTSPVAPAKPPRHDAFQGVFGRGHGGPSWSGEPRGAVVPRGDSEHVVLADCKTPNKDYLQSSQMAYYAGPANNAPDAITNVTYGKQQAWAGSGKITGVFSDNIAFSVEIPVPVGEGQLAGSGNNGYAAFSCYARFRKQLYTTKDGTVCDGVYDCDHTSPPVSSPSLPSSTMPPVASTAPTIPLSPTPTPTTLLTLATANNNQDGTATSSASTQPGGPSSSSSTALAATATGSRDAPSTDQNTSLTMDQKIAIGVGVGVGVPALLVALLAWLFPRKTSGQPKRTFRFSRTEMTQTTEVTHKHSAFTF